MINKIKSQKILEILKSLYPDAQTSLSNFSNTWEFLVAVILSAQCTDARVNLVTKKLFKKYKTISDYANCNLKELEKDIYLTGFYKSKAKYIKKSAKIILEKYKGQVPNTIDELIALPGVGRKTANVILGNAFHKPEGIAVDTHVKRIAKRLRFSKQTDPVKIEEDLKKIFDKQDWTRLTHLFIYHGRAICTAYNPKCENCALRKYCKYYKENKNNQ